MRFFFRYIILSSLLPALGFCNKSGGDIDPEVVFSETEKALYEHHAFFNDENKNELLTDAYRAALKSISGDTSVIDKKALTGKLKKYGETEKRLNTYKALGAFLASFPDKSSSFIPPESLVWSNDPERDSGIGLIIRQEGPGKFIAIDALEGSASHREKITMGNYITAVDDVSVSDMDLEELVGRIKGPVDSAVKISFKNRSYKLVRSRITFQNILHATWRLKGDRNVEYILLRSSLPETHKQLKSLIASFDNSYAYVIDLRKLQLGDFPESFKIADLFLASGRMGTLRTKNKADTVFDADSAVSFEGKIILLVGPYQSPYADAVALAMKNSDKVTLIGESIIGKKSYITKVVPLKSGIELRVATGYILNSDNQPLYETGIQTDYTDSSILPLHPPLTEPDPEDSAHMKCMEILNQD